MLWQFFLFLPLMQLDSAERKSYNQNRMKHITPLLIVGALLCSCQNSAPRNTIQMEVPNFNAADGKACSIGVNGPASAYEKVQISGPEAKEWDVFDRADAVLKYNQMPQKDKELLFDTVAHVYANLPADNKLTSEQINLGIWNELTQKGVDLSFGDDPADWNPYEMYIHPIVITEMTNFFINAKDGSISDEELNLWQKAGCNVINAKPDNLSMASLLARKDDLANAGIVIEEKDGVYTATAKKVDWAKYREEHHSYEAK